MGLEVKPSFKKYIDDLVAAAIVTANAYTDAEVAAAIAAYVTLSVYTYNDSESNAMLKAHAYRAVTDGIVSAYSLDSGAYKILTAYVGGSSDPVGAGVIIFSATSSGSGSNNRVGISGVLVAKDEYFEITYSGVDALVIRWKSFGTLEEPIDYN